MKKRGVLLLTTIALLLVAGIAGVLAYYTDSEQQNNRFQTATNKVEITEEFPPGDKTPGEPFTKKVAVKMMEVKHTSVSKFGLVTAIWKSIAPLTIIQRTGNMRMGIITIPKSFQNLPQPRTCLRK